VFLQALWGAKKSAHGKGILCHFSLQAMRQTGLMRRGLKRKREINHITFHSGFKWFVGIELGLACGKKINFQF